mmetsp:Transcript_2078/g.6188  ORF Transcript_2078/g.6188 Transcript_2078/m.6188 type:complete len:89 (-) Transcript_2078:429-695(-)
MVEFCWETVPFETHLAFVWHLIGFPDWQGVHVSPQCNRWTSAAANGANHTCPCHWIAEVAWMSQGSGLARAHINKREGEHGYGGMSAI